MNKLPLDFTINKYGLTARFVKVEDASLIVQMRTNPQLSKYLHKTSASIDEQINWINKYKEREALGSDYYFAFSIENVIYGFERIYNITEDYFTHGSLIFSENSPLGMSVLADIITREIGFDMLDMKFNYFDVRKKNLSVINYHKRYKPELISEDDDNLYFKLSKENFISNKNKYLHLFLKNVL